LWLANGEAAGSAALRLPLDVINVSSGFGLRADPLDKPGPPMGPLADPAPVAAALPPEPPPPKEEPLPPPPPPPKPRLFMHDGLDLVAVTGTEIYAAADGVVTGAGPNGRYGNWTQIDHAGKVTTVYGAPSRSATARPGSTRQSWG